MSRKLTERYSYILFSAKSPNNQPLDVLTIQQSLKSSLLQTCGETASTHIDILSVHEGAQKRSPGLGAVVIRINPSDKENVLAAIAMSGSEKNRLRFSVVRESTFLPSLISYVSENNDDILEKQ